MPGKAKPKDFKVGVHTKDRTLARIDRRTRPGRIMRQAIADLSQHVGGNPSAAERLLIQAAAIKSTRLFLLTEKLLATGETGELNGDNHVLAWLNSLRLDLQALGLEARIRDVTPTLKDIIAEHREAAE